VLTNPVLEAMFHRRSIREYTERMPSDEVVTTVVRAGQQAPFAYQLCSVLLPETFTFEDYGWTEHISRKAGQWLSSLHDLIEPLEARGFDVTPGS